MNKWFLWSFVSLITTCFFTSCNETGTNQIKDSKETLATFKMVVDQYPQTFLVRDVKDYYTSIVVNQVIEGLVKLDPKTLRPEGAVSEKWEVSEDGLTYTFYLRDNVFFHDHSCFKEGKGRKLNAQDIQYTFELICTKNEDGQASHGYSSILKETLDGAEDFFEGKTKSISGISISGDYTISLKIKRPDLNFPAKLSLTNFGIVAREVVECGKETDLIGTGPFRYGYDSDDGTPFIALVKNPEYYLKDENGIQLPYLDTVMIYVQNNQLEQLDLFERGKVHYIENIPPSRITHVLEDRIQDFSGEPPLMKLTNDPLLSTQYYSLNINSPALKDKRVRQALNYAIDRDRILSNVLKSSPQSGIYGIVPPLPKLLPGYDFSGVKEKGYSYDPEKARELLAEAGFPNGKGFPTLTLKFNTGTIHSAVADEFRKQMAKELGINVNLEGLSFEDRLSDETMAKGDLFRTAWYADYIGAESFLMNFYGKFVPDDINTPSHVNSSRYQNEQFDELFEKAQKEKNIEQRNRLFSEAEKIMLEDAPLIVLWYNEQFMLQYYNVRNLETNSILYLDLTKVRVKDWTKEEFNRLHP